MKHETLIDPKMFGLMYQAVFGVPYTLEIVPPVVEVVTEADSIVGFMAGHWNYDGSFYIQYSGVVPEHRKKGYAHYLKELLDDKTDYVCVTENTNIGAMKTLLDLAFIPMGVRQGGKGECFIEWTRRS